MAIITVGVLKRVIQNISDEYEIEFSNKTTVVPVTDQIMIDVSGKKLILK